MLSKFSYDSATYEAKSQDTFGSCVVLHLLKILFISNHAKRVDYSENGLRIEIDHLPNFNSVILAGSSAFYDLCVALFVAGECNEEQILSNLVCLPNRAFAFPLLDPFFIITLLKDVQSQKGCETTLGSSKNKSLTFSLYVLSACTLRGS